MDIVRYLFLSVLFAGIILVGTSTCTFGQTPEKQPSKNESELPRAEGSKIQGEMGRWMKVHDEMAGSAPGMGSQMGEGGEMMKRMMEGVLSPKEVPFYREKTFMAIVLAGFIIFIALMIRRWGIRPWKGQKKQTAFINEAILVVDLCESTKLAVTQGDAFAMRIKNKMKQCVREVAETLGANSFESTGDGYLITFPTGAGAARAAIRILQNADGYNQGVPEKERIELRVGIGYGEMVLDERGERHGAAINKAFRIEGLKKEDQERLGDGLRPEDFPEKNRIFVSEELREEIKGVQGIRDQLVGVFNLKGFTGLHRIYHIPWNNITLDI